MVNDKWICHNQVTAGIYEIEVAAGAPARVVSMRPMSTKTAVVDVISAKYDGTATRVIVHTKKYKNITKYVLKYSGDLVVGNRYAIKITFSPQKTFLGLSGNAANGTITAAIVVSV